MFPLMGGEEFVIAFPNTSLPQAIERAEAIRLAVSKHLSICRVNQFQFPYLLVSPSLTPQEEPESLFSRADKQLYLAKRLAEIKSWGINRNRKSVSEPCSRGYNDRSPLNTPCQKLLKSCYTKKAACDATTRMK